MYDRNLICTILNLLPLQPKNTFKFLRDKKILKILKNTFNIF